MNNTVLRLLQIFENETDSDHALTKLEIMDLLERDGYDKINEKQFYRKVEELRENGYDIEIRKGKQTRYFLRKNRLTREEWVFLITLIMGSKDLSKRETAHLISGLEGMSVCLKSIEYCDRYKTVEKTEKSPVHQFKNLRVILDAIDMKKQMTCKIILRRESPLTISDPKTILPIKISEENSRIKVHAIENGNEMQYFLGDIIDAELV